MSLSRRSSSKGLPPQPPNPVLFSPLNPPPVPPHIHHLSSATLPRPSPPAVAGPRLYSLSSSSPSAQLALPHHLVAPTSLDHRRSPSSSSSSSSSSYSHTPGSESFDEGKAEGSFGAEWVNFTQGTSIHGLTFFYDSTPFWIRRALWVLIFLAALSVLLTALVYNVIHYLDFPKSIDVTMTTEKSKVFPAVTICNMNSFRLSKAVQLNWFKQIDKTFGDYVPPRNRTEDDDDSLAPMNFTLTTMAPDTNLTLNETFHHNCTQFNETDAEAGVSTLTSKELYKCLGQRKEDLILKCTWGTTDCDLEKDFVHVLTDAGYCFTFNHDESKESSSTGTAQGVSLLMNVESYESMSGPTMSSGVRVMLHTSEEKNPLVQELGYSVSSGTHTTFAITSDKETRVKPPYGECQSSYLVDGKEVAYSESQCRRNCDLRQMNATCGCIDAFMEDINVNGSKLCTLADARDCTNPRAMELREMASGCKELCVVPCKATIFNPVYSFSTLTFVQATKLIDPATRSELISRQRLARDFASKVRDIWFIPDQILIDAVIRDYEAFHVALLKFLELAATTASSVDRETECLDEARSETEVAVVAAKHAADGEHLSLVEKIEGAQSEILSLTLTEIMTHIKSMTAMTLKKIFIQEPAVTEFETTRAQDVTDLITAANDDDHQTETLLNLTALSTQLKMTIIIQAETIKAMENNLQSLNHSSEHVGELVDKAKLYVDGKNETHPPTYLKTKLAEDFVSDLSALTLQRLTLNMSGMQMALESFFSQNLIFQSVKSQMCDGMIDCTECNNKTDGESVATQLKEDFVAAQTRLKSFLVLIDKFQSRLRDYKDSIEFTEDFVTRNILQVDIYYRGLSTTEIQQKRIYMLQDLFSDFGGLMGLCIGASLISVLEIFDFLIHFALKKIFL